MVFKKPFVKTYIFPEIWVAGNILFAIIAERLAYVIDKKWFLVVLIIYAIERVFEMFVYQMNVLFFHRLIPEYMEKTEREKKRTEHGVRRHIVGGANRTLFSVDLPPRLCRTGTCHRLQTG